MSEQKPLDERPHQPTDSKLAKARERGDVAKSEEFSSAFRFFFICLAIAMLWQSQVDGLKNLFVSNLERIGNFTPGDPILDWDLMLEAVYPVLIVSAVGILASFVARIIDVRGFVLNTEGMKPSFSQINPVNGMKQIFSLDSFLKFTTGFAKFLVITIAILFIFFIQANSAIWSISCGIGCQISLGFTIIAVITGTFLFLLTLSAGIDMKVSRFLHRRKNRMSTQELRQEQRDNYGSPEMKGAQHSFRRELADEPPEQQNRANLIIHNDDVVHALHVYANSQAVIVQTSGANLLASAMKAGVYCIKNDLLTEQLSQYPQGKPLPSEITGRIQQAISGT